MTVGFCTVTRTSLGFCRTKDPEGGDRDLLSEARALVAQLLFMAIDLSGVDKPLVSLSFFGVGVTVKLE